MKIHLLIAKLLKIRSFALALIVGLVFCAGGMLFLLQPEVERVETEATIVNIKEEYDTANDTYTHSAIVKFTANDGDTYTVDTGYYHSGMEIGDLLTIQYNPADPTDVTTPGSKFIPYIFLVVGFGIIIFGTVRGIAVLKTPAEETNRLDCVDMESVTEEQIDEVRQSTEETKEYYFHYTGSMNQGSILETPSRQPIFEAVLPQLSVVTAYQFDFINHLTMRTERKEVTHTVSTSYGGRNYSVMTDSDFCINGVNCWKVLGGMGYSLEPHMNRLGVAFDVKKYGIPVAYLESAGTNIVTGKNYKLGNIPAPGIYVVHCRESDIEGVFLACFCLSRTFN